MGIGSKNGRNNMTIYLTIASFIFVGGLIKKNPYWFQASIFLLFLFTLLRDPLLGGFDAGLYMDFFNIIPDLDHLSSYNSRFAIGYTFFNSLIKTFSSDYFVFQLCYTTISLALLYLIVSKLKLSNQEKCFWLFSYVCLHFFWNTWVTYRQNLANLLFWLFFILFTNANLEKQTWKRIVWLLLALLIPPLFHTSAWVNIVLIMCYWLIGKLNQFRLTLTIPILAILLFIFGDSLFSHFLYWMTAFVDERYNMYSDDTARGVNLINLLLRLVFFLWFAWFYKKDKYPYKNMVLSSSALSLLLGAVNAELMARMYEYFSIGLYTCISLTFRHIAPNGRWILFPFFWLGFIIILARWLVTFDGGSLLNYSFYW